MLKFRQNPEIISKLLKSKLRPSTQQSMKPRINFKKFDKIEEIGYVGLRSSNYNKNEIEFISNSQDGRPISAPEFIPLSRQFYNKKFQDPD